MPVQLNSVGLARKSRIEYAGAYYHVINRGNYRSWIFESEGARQSFLECLVQASESMGWRVHAWCLIGNHYHLCLQTPEPNLIEGMRCRAPSGTLSGGSCWTVTRWLLSAITST